MKMKLPATVLLAIILLSLVTALGIYVQAQEREITFYTHGWWQPPPARRFNPFAPGAIIIGGLVYERLAFWTKMLDEYIPELATSWEIRREENKIIVHLRRNAYWHDDTPFTCKDVWTTFMIYKALNRPIWKYISDVKCIDDYTVEFTVKEWIYLILHYLLFRDGRILGPYHIYGEFAERIAKASTSEEISNIVKELIEFEPETIIGTGPFKFVKITPSEVVLEKFEKYWAAEKIMIDKVIMPYIVSNEVGWDYYRAGRLDYDVFMMPAEVKKELEAKPFANIVVIYDLSGFALVFNFNNKWLNIREVRQAIAYAINREKVAEAAGAGLFEPVEYPTGLLKLSNEWIRELIDAGVLEKYEYNPAKAEELLKAAGFTKRGGRWYTPEGEPFKLTMIAPGGWTDWVAAMTEVAEELKAFGIEIELRTPESPSYWSDDWYLGGHYDLAIDFFGAWMIYPWAAMERMWIQVNERPRTQVQGENFPSKLYLPYFDEEINIPELVELLAKSFEREVQKEAAMKLAYAVNYYLPQFPIAEKYLVIFSNKERFVWADPSIKANYMVWQDAAGGHLDALAFMIRIGAVVPNPEYWGVTVTIVETITLPTPSPTPVIRTVTVTHTVTEVRTVTVTEAAVTVTETVTATVTETETVTTTSPIEVINWGVSAAFLVVGLVIGGIAGIVVIKKRGK